MPLIVLDAGHGGANPGATYNGRKESEDALALTLAVGSILEENGVDVYYTRTTDIYESPYQKAQEGNEVGGDYFVSIHRNSSPYPNQYSGVESLVYNRYGAAARMAYNINAGLEQVGFVNLGVNERPNLVVLNSTNMPAVLVEVGFINTDADNELFDSRFDEIARAIAANPGGHSNPYKYMACQAIIWEIAAGQGPQEIFDVGSVVSVGDKADFLAVRLMGYRKAGLARKLSGFRFFHTG